MTRFGGRLPKIRTTATSGGSGADPISDALGDAQRLTLPSTEGMPAASQQVMVAMRGISHDLVFSSSDADTVAWATGTITLSDQTSYSITGANTGNMAALTYIYLDTDTSSTALQTSTTYSNAVGNNKYLIAVAQNATTAASYIVVAGNGGFGGEVIVAASMISNLLITANQIANATITSGKTKIGLHSVSHNLVFSSTDFNTVAWASGTVVNSAGTSYTITGSNTGNMSARTYVYLDTDVSTTALQTTTTYSTAVGDNKILIAVAEDAADTSALAFFQVFDGIGGVFVNAENIATLSITASLISNLTITASQIANLTLNTAKMTFGRDAAFGDNYIIDGSFESWSSGTTSAPDGWTLTGAGATIARVTTSGNVQYGQAAVTVTAALNTATDLAQTITISATVNTALRGPFVTFSCRVKASTASRVFLKVDDGIGTTSSSNHSGGGDWETLSVTRDVDDAATKLECSLEISSGASISATFDGAMLTTSQTAVEYSQHPGDLFLVTRRAAASGATTRNVNTMTVLDSMSLANVALSGNQSVFVIFTAVASDNVAAQQVQLEVRRDTTIIGPPTGNNEVYRIQMDTASTGYTLSVAMVDTKPAAGLYTYDVRWKVPQGVANTATIEERELVVVPFPQP